MHITWQALVDARKAALDPFKLVWQNEINDQLSEAGNDTSVSSVVFSTNLTGPNSLRAISGGDPGSQSYAFAIVDMIIADAAAAGFPTGNPVFSAPHNTLTYTLPTPEQLS